MSLSTKLSGLNRRLYPQHLFYAPEWLVLGVNNVCNLHCKMCDVGIGNKETNFAQNLTGSKPLNMPLELITDIIQQAGKYYPKVKIGYAFTEPLVYPHFIESLHLAGKNNLFTAATTNALTLPQKAEEICKAGLKEINISLDGPQDIHNFIRGNKNSFQKAIEGIEKLISFDKRPDISVFCVITEWNVPYLVDFLKIFNAYPLKQIGFMHTNFTPDWLATEHNKQFGHLYPATLSNTEEINIEKMNLELLWEQLQEIKSTEWNFPVSCSPEIGSLTKLKEFYLNPEIPFGKKCNDVFRNIMIKTDGSVIPAHGRCFNLTLGNLHQQSLPQIWNSAVYSKFRKTLNNAGGLFPACNRCCSAFND